MLRKTTNASNLKTIVLALLPWFDENARDLPWRRTSDPYVIWISEIMLQQTQVKTVIAYWGRWMRHLPSLKDLAKAPQEKVLKLWEGLGYYNRVRNAQNAAQHILDQHYGIFPQTIPELLALPGIGRYTAGAIASIAFNQPAPILDGNVSRVLCRVFALSRDPRQKSTSARLWQLAEELVHQAAQSKASQACSHFNQAMMELGALVCTPQKAQCTKCPLGAFCLARKQNRVDQLPTPKTRPATTRLHFAAFLVQQGNKFLVRQRPDGVVNAGFWEFPNVQVGSRELSRFARPFVITNPKPLHTLRHSITRYRITLQLFQAKIENSALRKSQHGVFKSLPELKRLPLTAAHRKLLDAIPSRTT